MTERKDCGRPKARSLAHWFQSDSRGTCAPVDPDELEDGDEDSLMAHADCMSATIDRLRTQLAASEFENRCWRALAEHSSGGRRMLFDEKRSPSLEKYTVALVERGDGGLEFSEGPTPQAAAIALARQLKLVPEETKR